MNDDGKCNCEACEQARANAKRVYCPRCGREVAMIDPQLKVCTACASASVGTYDESETT